MKEQIVKFPDAKLNKEFKRISDYAFNLVQKINRANNKNKSWENHKNYKIL